MLPLSKIYILALCKETLCKERTNASFILSASHTSVLQIAVTRESFLHLESSIKEDEIAGSVNQSAQFYGPSAQLDLLITCNLNTQKDDY